MDFNVSLHLRSWELALCFPLEKHADHNDTLYRDYVNNQEDLREVLDQLFQVNCVISLRIWIVRLQSCVATFSQK